VKTLKKSALAAFAALALAACDGDGGTGVGGLPRGQFEGDVSGVLDMGLAGEAVSGYYTSPAFHDIIILTDYTRDVRITLYESADEFVEGRWRIDDENEFDSEIVAYVEDLETGETFSSVDGTLDLVNVSGSGIEGSALFTAESDEFGGDYLTVDVVFDADYDGRISVNRSPSFFRAEKR
jgi:hypothetical protein